MGVDYSQPPRMVTFSGANCLDWVLQVERYFFCYFVQDSIKLPLASLFIKGEAFEWFLQLYRNHEFRDWDHFVDELFICFRHYDSRQCFQQFTDQTRDAPSSKDVDVQPGESVEEHRECVETNAATVFDKSPQSSIYSNIKLPETLVSNMTTQSYFEVVLVEVVEPTRKAVNEVELADDQREDTQVLAQGPHQIETPILKSGMDSEVTTYALESAFEVGQSAEGSTVKLRIQSRGEKFPIGRVLSIPSSVIVDDYIRLANIVNAMESLDFTNVDCINKFEVFCTAARKTKRINNMLGSQLLEHSNTLLDASDLVVTCLNFAILPFDPGIHDIPVTYGIHLIMFTNCQLAKKDSSKNPFPIATTIIAVVNLFDVLPRERGQNMIVVPSKECFEGGEAIVLAHNGKYEILMPRSVRVFLIGELLGKEKYEKFPDYATTFKRQNAFIQESHVCNEVYIQTHRPSGDAHELTHFEVHGPSSIGLVTGLFSGLTCALTVSSKTLELSVFSRFSVTTINRMVIGKDGHEVVDLQFFESRLDGGHTLFLLLQIAPSGFGRLWINCGAHHWCCPNISTFLKN